MKFITSKDSIARKIVIVLLIALTLTFAIVPNYSVYATENITTEDMPDDSSGIMTSLLKEIVQIIDAIGDIIMGTLNRFMVGADGFTSAMLSVSDPNVTGDESWLRNGVDSEVPDFEYSSGTIDTSNILPWVHNQFDIPNFLYAPEAIFTNNIAALDVNFLNPNTYDAVSNKNNAEKAARSAAGTDGLRETIANWYISFRNIAIVGLLSVLVYLGIRILISSTAVDKAKYKENLQNWVVALCLVFFIHFIMSGLLMITDKFNELFDSTANSDIVISAVGPSGETIKFRTNLIGYIRFNAQSTSMYNVIAYSLLYLVLVIYTCIFTIMYFKRFLYMAFLTMIAPLVALTYPIDKAGDGKAQAFDKWFKEYVMHLILQPVHLILYVALVSSAMELVKDNMIYALVAIGFLIPAEKFIKDMFGLNKATTTSGIGSFAGGALAMQGFNKLANAIGGGKSKKSIGKGGNSDSSDSSQENNRIRTQDRDFAQSFNNNEDDQNGRQLLNDPNAQNRQDEQQPNDENDERQQLLDDRQVWNDMANDQNETEQNRLDAQQEVDNIDEEMRNRGYNNNQQDDNGINPVVNPNRVTGNVPREDWKKKLAIKGVKSTGKKLYKGMKGVNRGIVRAGAVAGGATIGLAAGIATGDLGKVGQFMSAGAIAGKAIGKRAANVADLPEKLVDSGVKGVDAIRNQADGMRYEMDKAKYGTQYAANRLNARQDEREKTRFLNNKEEKKKYEEMADRISIASGRDVKAEDLMQSAYDYKKAGINDEKQIENGLTMEAKYQDSGNIHENMLDIVGMTSKYGEDYVMDDKKRQALQKRITNTVRGEANQDKVWNMYTETLGFKQLDKSYDIQRKKEPSQPTQPTKLRQRIPRDPEHPNGQQSNTN